MSTPERKIPCDVLDKRRKDGWFGTSYYVTFRIQAEITRGTKTFELEVPIDVYHDCSVGGTGNLSFYQHGDGFWYPYLP